RPCAAPGRRRRIVAAGIERDPLVPRRRNRAGAARAWDRAQCLSWMFFEQYSHEPYVAVTRNIMSHMPKERAAPFQARLPELIERGNHALGVMESHLAKHEWFAGTSYSIADIALYAYTHKAEEGGYRLKDYPAVSRWLARVAAQPGYIPMFAEH